MREVHETTFVNLNTLQKALLLIYISQDFVSNSRIVFGNINLLLIVLQ